MASVVVGCKLPHGLQIRLGEKIVKVDTHDPRDRHVLVQDAGKPVALKGTHSRAALEGFSAVGGYGLTVVDDGDAMKKWLADNDNHPAVKNGLIFIESSADRAKGAAKERSKLKNGTEPLDYDNPLGDGSVEPTKTLEQAKQDAAEQAAAR